jgi:hypothetical protein
VPVTLSGSVNVYDYRSEDLYLAYGLSILVAVACFAIGLVSIRRNAGSYTNDFSTVLRTTRHPSLLEVVDSVQSSGLSPLGKELAAVRIVLVESNGDPDVPTGFRVSPRPDAERELLAVEKKANPRSSLPASLTELGQRLHWRSNTRPPEMPLQSLPV